MRFTAAAAAAIMAGSAIATDVTVSTTELITVTDCGPTVTNCPAHSTRVTTSVGPSMTTSTVYTHVIHTVTSCAPTVTNCPAHSTVLSTETIPVYTTVCPVVTSTPGHYPNGTVPGGNQPGGNQPGGNQPGGNKPPGNVPVPVSSAAPACPTHSVTAITKSYTTVLTSVEYSTVEVPCPTVPAGGNPPAESSPAGNQPGGNQPGGNQPGAPQPTGSVPGNNNGTTPSNPPTAGAGSLAGSAVFAAVAGLVALAL